MCVRLPPCARANKTRGVALGRAVLSYFHHSSLFYEAPKPRDSPNNFNESEDPAGLVGADVVSRFSDRITDMLRN